jgi:hypothetical protein
MNQEIEMKHLEVSVSHIYFCSPDCWLEVSMHPEGPATGHLDTGFLGFPLSLSKCWDGTQVPSCYCVLLMQPSRLKFIKIKLPCWQSHYNYIFKIILNLKSKFRGPISQATASKHSNAFTFMLLLSEGRAGEAWEPSYKIILFPLPTLTCLSLLPGLFTFIYSSTFYLSLSLSLESLKG